MVYSPVRKDGGVELCSSHLLAFTYFSFTIRLPFFFFSYFVFLTAKTCSNLRIDGHGKIVTECNLLVCNLNILKILDLSTGNVE